MDSIDLKIFKLRQSLRRREIKNPTYLHRQCKRHDWRKVKPINRSKKSKEKTITFFDLLTAVATASIKHGLAKNPPPPIFTGKKETPTTNEQN